MIFEYGHSKSRALHQDNHRLIIRNVDHRKEEQNGSSSMALRK